MSDTLNKEQLSAIESLKSRRNVFITGSPGTGKSYVLRCCIKYIKQTERRFAITSSTGCSAVLIGGQTLHSYIGIGTGKLSVAEYAKSISQKRYKLKALTELDVLFIDEISMIDDKTFDKISEVLCAVRKNRKPFGGVQMVLVGDFCQLSPVTSTYCFLSKAWNDLDIKIVILKEMIRQKDDCEFQKILEEIRFGKCSKKTFKVLMALKDTDLQGIVPTRLFALNTDVNAINRHGQISLYTGSTGKDIKTAKIVPCFPYTTAGLNLEILNSTEHTDEDVFRYQAVSNDATAKLEEYCVDLVKGDRILVTRNVSMENGLVNGSTGTIVALDTDRVTMLDIYGKTHTIYYYKDVNENSEKYIKFMPIRLAYALSIHKSQGATLDAVEVDGSSNIFAPGQLYTALSRCKSLQSIRVVNLDAQSFICNKHVKEFYAKHS